MTVSHETKLCNKCKNEPRREGQRYGNNCHAEYQRQYRRKKYVSNKVNEQVARFVERITK